MAAAQVLRPTQPDIQYHPDYEKYQARSQRRKDTEDLSKILPDGFPQQLSSTLVWEGKDVEQRDDWILRLNEAQLDELDQALKSFKGNPSLKTHPHVKSMDTDSHFLALKKPLGCINQSTFPLPALHVVLRAHSKELHFGRGFFVLRGLRIDSYSREDNIIIYAGLSSHIGNIRGRQEDRLPDGKSLVLYHIKDLTKTAAGTIGTPANTTDKQVFHTDSGDIISLLCLQPAAKGGESKISSSWNVYNILAKERPDLIRTLSEGWPVDG